MYINSDHFVDMNKRLRWIWDNNITVPDFVDIREIKIWQRIEEKAKKLENEKAF